MKYPDIRLGRVEAVWNIIGGEREVDRLLRGELIIVEKLKKEKILVPIAKLQRLELRALSGERNIIGGKEVFSTISRYFNDFGLDVPGKKSKPSLVSVFKTVKDATFAQIFHSLGRPLESLVLTQDQVVEFCIVHHEHLLRGDGYGTFFLIKENEELFVLRVFFSNGASLEVSPYRFERNCVWDASRGLRVVVPAVATGKN